MEGAFNFIAWGHCYMCLLTYTSSCGVSEALLSVGAQGSLILWHKFLVSLVHTAINTFQ